LLRQVGLLYHQVLAWQGERAKALSSLRKAFTRDPQLVTNAPEDPDISSLVDDPEFTALLEYPYSAPAPDPQNVGTGFMPGYSATNPFEPFSVPTVADLRELTQSSLP
jgi:hypothetical protein